MSELSVNAPTIAKDVLTSLEHSMPAEILGRQRVGGFLDQVATDARALADIWFELLEVYRGCAQLDGDSSGRLEVPEEIAAKVRKTSLAQGGYFANLRAFYWHIRKCHPELINGNFVLSMADLLECRENARNVLGRGFVVKDWLDNRPAMTKVESLENAVLLIHDEAWRLGALARIYRAS